MPPHTVTSELNGVEAEQNIPNIFKKNKKSGGEKKEILYKGFYYDVTSWIKIHPGGDIINFYSEKGEDATLAVGQFHHRSIKKVRAILQSFKKRPANDNNNVEDSQSDPSTSKKHCELTKDFNTLYRQLESEGYFDPSPWHVALRLFECLFLTLLGIYLTIILGQTSLTCQLVGTVVFGVLAARFGYLMHEGGHNSLTGWPKVDQLIQAFALGLGIGLSSSFFSKHHSRHHAMPQRIHRDSDLETLPLLAFNKKVMQENPKLGQKFFIRHQAILFLAVDTFLVATYWKLYLHPKFALQNGKFHQLFFMSLHYIFAYYMGFWSYLIAAWLGSSIILGNIALSHLHFPLANEPLHWVEYSLQHSTDVEPSWWCDWWMGYLNYQIEHHLFPAMPQYKNKQIRDRVKTFAAKHGIPYNCCSYFEAVQNCYKNLVKVSQELEDD